MSTFDVKAELFEQLARIGKTLGSAYRLQLLDLLAQGERSVDVLAQLCRLSVTNASQHLQHLRRAGLVRARKEGLYVHYRRAATASCASLRPCARWARSTSPRWTS